MCVDLGGKFAVFLLFDKASAIGLSGVYFYAFRANLGNGAKLTKFVWRLACKLRDVRVLIELRIFVLH